MIMNSIPDVPVPGGAGVSEPLPPLDSFPKPSQQPLVQ